METPYLIAGKRFRADNVSELNKKLFEYGLISNLNNEGLGNLSVRKISDGVTNNRYDIVQTYGDSADSDFFDVIVGKLVAKNAYNHDDVEEVELSNLEEALNEVRQDIPEAKILLGSYWS